MPPSPRSAIDWRGRLETRAAWWTLLAGVPVFVLSALAIVGLAVYAAVAAIRGEWLLSLWAVAGMLLAARAVAISVEALGQLWWRRLLHALALWALVTALWPGWWAAQG